MHDIPHHKDMATKDGKLPSVTELLGNIDAALAEDGVELSSLRKENKLHLSALAEANAKEFSLITKLKKEREGRAAEAERVKALEVELAEANAKESSLRKENKLHLSSLVEANAKESSLITKLKKESEKRAAEAKRFKALEVELAKLKGKSDEQSKEKEDLQKIVEDLKLQTELTLLQLHEVQEELERNFYQLRGKDELLKRRQAQQLRAKQLISKLLAGN